MRACLSLSLFLLAVTFAPSALALNANEIDDRARACAALLPNVDTHAACSYALALEVGDATLCNRIFWAPRALACKRSIAYGETWTVKRVAEQSVFLIPFLLLPLSLVFAAKRRRYLYAVILGDGVSALVTYAHVVVPPDDWQYDAYLPVLVSPVQGWLMYSPAFLTAWPLWGQLLLLHAAVYTLAFGLIFQGKPLPRFLGFSFFFCSIVFSLLAQLSFQGSDFFLQLHELLRN